MSMPMSVSLRIGAHLMKQKLRGNKRFPLIVELVIVVAKLWT